MPQVMFVPTDCVSFVIIPTDYVSFVTIPTDYVSFVTMPQVMFVLTDYISFVTMLHILFVPTASSPSKLSVPSRKSRPGWRKNARPPSAADHPHLTKAPDS